MPAPRAAPSPRPPPPASDIRASLGLRPIINVSGTMTALGASMVVPEAVAAVGAVFREFVEIDDLQRKASKVIARLSGAEAGFVTASSAAGITLSVAAAMTGPDLAAPDLAAPDLAAIERLPDTSGLRNEVLIQLGHMVGYGAPVEQAIRLAGARFQAKRRESIRALPGNRASGGTGAAGRGPSVLSTTGHKRADEERRKR